MSLNKPVMSNATQFYNNTPYGNKLIPIEFRRISFQSWKTFQRRSHRSFNNRTRLELFYLARRRHATRDRFNNLQVPRRPPTGPSNGDLSEEKKLQVITVL